MQGEQVVFICVFKIVQQVFDFDVKFYVLIQVMDEVCYVEVYKGLMQKFGVVYLMIQLLVFLVDDVLCDSCWDFIYFVMQVVIEGLVLVVFGMICDLVQNLLVKMVNVYVMEDEVCYVVFGCLMLCDYYFELM